MLHPVIPDIPNVYANPTHVKSWQQMLPEQYAHTGQIYKETEKKFKCEEPLLWYMYLKNIYIFSINMYQVNIYV